MQRHFLKAYLLCSETRAFIFNLLTFTTKRCRKTHYYLQNRDKGTVERNFSPFPNKEQKTQIQTGGKKAGGEWNTSALLPERSSYASNTNIFKMGWKKSYSEIISLPSTAISDMVGCACGDWSIGGGCWSTYDPQRSFPNSITLWCSKFWPLLV